MGFSHGKIIRMRSLSPDSLWGKAWIENQAQTSQENNGILSVKISRASKT